MPAEPERARVWRHARVATMVGGGLGMVDDAAIVAAGSRIAWVGPDSGVPAALLDGAEVSDVAGRLVLPGLVDCHTHLVFATHRAREFEMRLAGATYTEIANAGGGIVSSVRTVRAASKDELLAATLPRLDALLADGVTTIEVKSGYGLDLVSERGCLRVARRLAEERSVRVQTTCLVAHTIPPEWKNERSGYVDLVTQQILPTLAGEGLVDAVDAFCETIAFLPAEAERVFAAARTLGLPIKLHADQLTDGDGARLAAKWGALSADHVEHTSDAGDAAMAQAGTVAVLLPGAFHMLRETQTPPVDSFRRHGVAMAVSTDANPGTSPLLSPRLAMNFAAVRFGLTVEECLLGVTRHAARALGLHHEIGAIEVGKQADLSVWNVEEPAELVYWMGANLLHERVIGGVP